MFWGAWEGGSLWGCDRASLVGPCPSLTDSGDGIRALCLCPGSALFLRDPLLWGLTSGIVRHHPEPGIPQPLPQQRLLRVVHPAGGPGPQNPAPVYGCGVSLAGHWLWAWEWLRPRCGALAASAQALGRGGNAAGLLGLRLVQPVVQTDVPLPQAGRQQLLLRCHRGVRRRVPPELAPRACLQQQPSCLHLIRAPAHRPVSQ